MDRYIQTSYNSGEYQKQTATLNCRNVEWIVPQRTCWFSKLNMLH